MSYPAAVDEERHEPRPRRLWPLWTAIAVVVALLACGLPVALVVVVAREASGRMQTVRDPAVIPGPDDPAARRLADGIDAQLDRQAGALLRGDRAGFLAVADPTARRDLTRQFAALRALQVTIWRPELSSSPIPVDGQPGEWRLLVTYRYCFVEQACTPSPVLIGTHWRETGDRPRLVSVEPSKSQETGTRPWEISELAVAVGERTLVAATPALRKKLPGLLAEAEAAAAVADGYAVAGRPPDRYRIFYAGRDEWQRWYGGGRPKWTGGYAVAIGGGHHEVVLNAEGLRSIGVDDLLRHELTHAASLPVRGNSGDATWWLVEGIAELAGFGGQSVAGYDGLPEVRRLVKAGWDGRLERLAPAGDTPAEQVGGSYGIGFLAVRHLVDRYGEEQMLAFFKAVVHDRKQPAEASEQVFGEPWPTLHDDCVAYVRSFAS